MATTSPDGISYPTNADAQKTIEQRFQDTATSVQTALNNRVGAVETINSTQNTRLTALELPGRVLQVQTTSLTSTWSQSLSAGTDGSAFLSVAITPRFANSKIIIQWHANGSNSDTSMYPNFSASTYRGGTKIGNGTNSGSNTTSTSSVFIPSTDSSGTSQISGIVVDSPNTTSSVTYSVVPTNTSAQTRTLYVNGPTRTDIWASRTISTLIVMEVAQ